MIPGLVRGIYAICNTVTGEAYIGRTSVLDDRWKAHRAVLRRGQHPNTPLQMAWQRDGAAAFTLVTLERIESSDHYAMADRERYWLARARAAGVRLYNDQVGRRRAA